MVLLGPLFRLRLHGFLCPCSESEDDRAARAAAVSLQSVPVAWHRTENTMPTAEEATAKVGQYIDPSAGGGAVGSLIKKGVRALTEKGISPTSRVAVDATLSVVDGPSGPSIRISPNMMSATKKDFADADDTGTTDVGVCRYPAVKTVPFSSVGNVSPGGGWNLKGRVSCGVVVQGRILDSRLHEAAVGGAKLLEFDVVPAPVHAVSREEVLAHLEALAAWDARRQLPKQGGNDVAAAAAEGSFVSIGDGGNATQQSMT